MKNHRKTGVYTISKDSCNYGYTAMLKTGKFIGAICRNQTNPEEEMWWSNEKKTFVKHSEIGQRGGCTHSRHQTYRSYLRFLRKNPQLKGNAIILISLYQHNDIIAV